MIHSNRTGLRRAAGALLLAAHSVLAVTALQAQPVRGAVVTAPIVPGTLQFGAAAASQLNFGQAGLGASQFNLGTVGLTAPALNPSLSALTLPTPGAQTRAVPAAVSATPLVAGRALPRASSVIAARAEGSAIGRSLLNTTGRRKDAPASTREGDEAAPDLAAGALFDGSKAQAPKEWTFMVFLNGHNNLDSFGAMNIKQMEQVGSNDRVNIVVQWASLGKPTKRMLIQRSESGTVSSPVIETLPAVDMGDAAQLSEFIRWTVERFPAAKYMVDIWDHGAGWHVQPRGEITPHDISYDDQTGHHITTEQLGDVMRKAAKLIGHPVDVLGFDACLMAMIEVVAETGGAVRYVAGSEQTEPGAGWPYDKVLKAWLAAPPDDGLSLLQALTKHFIAAYSRGVTFSGIDARKLPALVAATKTLAAEIAKLDAAGLAEVQKASRATRRYAYRDYGDFLDFVLRLAKAPVPVVAPPVLDAVIAAYKAMVVSNGASADMSGSNGMSIWLPTDSGTWGSYAKRYLGLVWHKLSAWGDALRRMTGGT
ncbi:MAG: hypothetical protein A2X36_15075 [Elusimicrobia bacterium GWA2_69_24]|nr:MAG: hypothetical protein A2X36_15075 [Elusimicrobia bacterium GWA2_69_24]HBL15343.1 hypothetical protein [Elusimicrobiota bacterium]